MSVNICHNITNTIEGSIPFKFSDANFGFTVDEVHRDKSRIGYYSFIDARSRILSNFDSKIGLEYCTYNIFKEKYDVSKDILLKEMEEEIPKFTRDFALSNYNNGSLSSRQCEKILGELGDNYSAFNPIQWTDLSYSLLVNNDSLKSDDTAFNTAYIIEAMRKSARDKMYFIWY